MGNIAGGLIGTVIVTCLVVGVLTLLGAALGRRGRRG